ncbi:hypothetical protein LTR56_022753 [Elasticomyces elasticus]|nr:hypothetical protein LTR56_022753 [Elasticomyces elasticus]KAK3627815.1 hypothetical protein LTR22_022587 [Elasticomyces elasticus]KAK4907911.1 hypothetical protein LTR49_023114 [Elasticomyces elasticus]KAK5748039.1 hypothetical protein LTS12_021899 [Elasticomyces elasticus]
MAGLEAKKSTGGNSASNTVEYEHKSTQTLPPHIRAARAKLASKVELNPTTAEKSGVAHGNVESSIQHQAAKAATTATDTIGKAQIPINPEALVDKAIGKGIESMKLSGQEDSSVPPSRAVKTMIVEYDDVRRAAQKTKRAGAAAPIRTADDVWVKVDYVVSEDQDWEMVDKVRAN